MVSWAGFMDLHVFRFSPRPRTAAARYPDQVPREVSHARSQALIEQAHRQHERYAARFDGRPLHPIWDRSQGDVIKGVTENYLQASAPAARRTAGQLEEALWPISAGQ
jgi:threonylcarbamoyladenosine tRNA methylthiotransferase MtaB